jgi:pilus assembly protein Flp/PilA
MWFLRLLRENSGATAIEYGLIAAMVSVAVVGALSGLGASADTLFGTLPPILDAFQSAMGG